MSHNANIVKKKYIVVTLVVAQVTLEDMSNNVPKNMVN